MSKEKDAVVAHAKGGNKVKDTKVKETKDRSGAVSGFIRKLSGGLMIPIALLPIAGLFLGVGAGFENVFKQAADVSTTVGTWGYIFTIFKMIGDMIFGNLPVLFCLGVALAFSDDVGTAVFTGIVAWITFNATQSAFIWEYSVVKDASGVEIYSGLNALMDSTLADAIAGHAADYSVTTSYSVGPYLNGMVPSSVVAANMGITSMQTSVFGGILMGFWAAYMYNKFHEFEAPKILGFFSGTRFVPIITFLTVPLWGMAFVLVWPIVGIGLDWFGAHLMLLPFGTDAFVFGVVERSLIPFGLHHAFYSPLWYTSVGGALYSTDGTTLGSMLAGGDQTVWFEMQSLGIPFTALASNGIAGLNPVADGWNVVEKAINNNGIDYDVITSPDGVQYAITHGMNPGQYQQGKFPFMLFGLPAAGAAMIMAAKKENRELAMSVIGASALTAFLTGITEPIEFTFLFLAPYLYYGFHIWMAGLSFMMLDLLGSHIGMTFSGGIFDYALFGILPDATGLGSNCWWVLIIGAIYAPIYYFFFLFMIKKMDIKTPGRDDSNEVVMVSKADYREAKGIGSSDKKPAKAGKEDKDAAFQARLDILLESLGGVENLTNVNACATKLRLQVVDEKVIDFDRIKNETGAFGFSGMKGKSPMIVYGAEAQKFKTWINKLK